MKKRLLSIVSVALCSILTAVAEQIQVPDITMTQGGSATMEISLNNEHADFVAFQMDLTLPEGITIDKAGCELSSRITDEKQELVIGKLESGAFRLTSTSMSLTPIKGSEGSLLILKLSSNKNFVQGNVTINNIIFSTSDSERVTMNDVSFAINTQYTLTYKVDGVEYKIATIAYGSAITPETEPTKEGYTFSGWSWIPQKMPAEDVTVTGTFTVNNYTLTYMLEGKEYKTLTVAYGTVLTPEAEPTKEGYTFSGWSWIPKKMPAEDVVVTGSFTVNSYTVTFMDGDKVLYTEKVNYGEAIPIPEILDKYGLVYKWLDVPETMPAHDVVLLVDETDMIDGPTPSLSKGEGDVYDLNGRKLPALQKGVNIIRLSDGTSRKVLVK